MNTIDEIQNELKLLRHEQQALINQKVDLVSPALGRLLAQIDDANNAVAMLEIQLMEAEDARTQELNVRLERDGVEL